MLDSIIDDDVQNELTKLDEVFDTMLGNNDIDTSLDNKKQAENNFENEHIPLKLLVGIMDDHGIVRPTGASSTFQLDTDGIINQTRGTCCIKFPEGGGIKNSNFVGGRKEKMPDDPDTVEKSHLETRSLKERVPLTSPFIWDNEGNWMGVDYLPPVGSKVILGFDQHGEGYILGYLPQKFPNHEYLKDRGTLQAGEMVFKGFGNNYIHLRKSNKMVLQTWAKEGTKDIDQPDGQKTADKNHKCEIFLDGDNGRITLSVGKNQIVISEEGISLLCGTTSGITLSEAGISVNASVLTETVVNRESSSSSNTVNS